MLAVRRDGRSQSTAGSNGEVCDLDTVIIQLHKESNVRVVLMTILNGKTILLGSVFGPP